MAKDKMPAGWTLGRKAMVFSLAAAHVWGTMLILAVMAGKDSAIIDGMFQAVCFSIFSTLAVLVGGKAWKDFAPLRWNASKGGNDAEPYQDAAAGVGYSGGAGRGCARRDCPLGVAECQDRHIEGGAGEPAPRYR